MTGIHITSTVRSLQCTLAPCTVVHAMQNTHAAEKGMHYSNNDRPVITTTLVFTGVVVSMIEQYTVKKNILLLLLLLLLLFALYLATPYPAG